MSKENIVRYRLTADSKGTMTEEDWRRIDALTEEEINAQALADPDNPPLTDEELDMFLPVVDVKKLRKKLGITQKEFAKRYRLHLGTIRDWEQMRSLPDAAASVLLVLIDRDHEAVDRILAPRRLDEDVREAS